MNTRMQPTYSQRVVTPRLIENRASGLSTACSNRCSRATVGEVDPFDFGCAQIVAGISESRALSVEKVEKLIDQAPLNASTAVKEGLVDAILYPDQVRFSACYGLQGTPMTLKGNR